MPPHEVADRSKQLDRLAELRCRRDDLSMLSVEELARGYERCFIEGRLRVEGFDVAAATPEEIRAVAFKVARVAFEEDRRVRAHEIRRIFAAPSKSSSAPARVRSGSSPRARERRGRTAASRSTAAKRGDPPRPRPTRHPTTHRLPEGRS